MKKRIFPVLAIAAMVLAGSGYGAGVKPPYVKFKEAYVYAQEGNDLLFPVVLAKTWNEKVTVWYDDYTDWGSARDADSCADTNRNPYYNPDYEEPGITSRNLKFITFMPGVREAVIKVKTCPDSMKEGHETVVLYLKSAKNAWIQQGGYGANYARGTIQNNDR